MIKLTRFVSGLDLFVDPDNISVVYKNNMNHSETCIMVRSGKSFSIKETPEEVLELKNGKVTAEKPKTDTGNKEKVRDFLESKSFKIENLTDLGTLVKLQKIFPYDKENPKYFPQIDVGSYMVLDDEFDGWIIIGDLNYEPYEPTSMEELEDFLDSI